MLRRRSALWLLAALPLLLGAYWTGVAFLNVQQSWTAGQGTTCVALTDASTIAVDASKSNCFTVTLTASGHTLGFPSSAAPVSGQELVYVITQDGTGSRTMLWGSGYNFPGGIVPALHTAAAAVDIISCIATSGAAAQCGWVIPTPSATTLGGTESFTCASHQWESSLSTSGVPACTQPAFTDISGTATAAQLPNPTASTLGGIESIVAVSHQWVNTISTSGVPALTQPAFSDISGALALAQVPAGGSNLQFLQTNGSGTGVWASHTNSICGSSGVTLNGAGATDFIGIGALSTTQALTWLPAPYTGTAVALYVSSGAAAGSAKTFTYTVMGGTTGATAEALTCAITGTSQVACNDTGHTFAITAADLLSLKVVTTAASATTTHSWCLKVTVP
jgi:hypothetical protein